MSKFRTIVTLNGLPGVRESQVRAVMVQTVNGFEDGLREFKAVTAAGDLGAINVWKSDDGFYRANASRYMIDLDSQRFGAKKLVMAWVKEWLPKIRGVK